MVGVKYIGPVYDHCYSSDTEVLTDSGWKLFPDVQYSDKLATLSEEHHLEYHHPDKLISTPWEGDLLRFYSKDGIDLLVSPNHKMYVQTESSRRKLGETSGWKLEDACDSFGSTRYYKKDASYYLQRGPETLNIVGRDIKTEEWLEFLGYYLSEGSATTTERKDYIVQIRQTKDDTVLERMGYALSKVSPNKTNIRPDGRVVVNDKELCLYLKETFGHCYTKHIPREILNSCSREQLSILYDALVIGDGKITPDDETGGCYYATSSVQLKDDFQELQLKVGLSGDSYVAAFPGDTTYLQDGRKITCTTDLWKISIRRKRGGTSLKSDSCASKPVGYSNFEKTFYKGNIHCATVKNHVMYVRRNGKALWCGNSGYGEASRNYVLALHRAGVPVTVTPHCFERNPPVVGSAADRETLKEIVNKDIDFDVVIVHLTPDLAPAYVRKYPDKYVISYTVWETSKLHPTVGRSM
jgi:replicative DNA helicase Mcm